MDPITSVTVGERSVSVPSQTKTAPEIELVGEKLQLVQLADLDKCPFNRWASTAVYLDTEDPEHAKFGAGYSFDGMIACVAVRAPAEPWEIKYFRLELPATELVFDDPQSRNAFVETLKKFKDGVVTHPVLSPLLAHLVSADDVND